MISQSLPGLGFAIKTCTSATFIEKCNLIVMSACSKCMSECFKFEFNLYLYLQHQSLNTFNTSNISLTTHVNNPCVKLFSFFFCSLASLNSLYFKIMCSYFNSDKFMRTGCFLVLSGSNRFSCHHAPGAS